MKKEKEDELVMCPYYREDGQQSIHCEGVEDGCKLHLGFANRGGFARYKRTLCRKNWDQCMVARMLNLKYDYEP